MTRSVSLLALVALLASVGHVAAQPAMSTWTTPANFDSFYAAASAVAGSSVTSSSLVLSTDAASPDGLGGRAVRLEVQCDVAEVTGSSGVGKTGLGGKYETAPVEIRQPALVTRFCIIANTITDPTDAAMDIGKVFMSAVTDCPANSLPTDGSCTFSPTDAGTKPLFDVIGYTFSPSGTTSGSYCVPKIDNVAVIGANGNVGASVGSSSSVVALPSHKHGHSAGVTVDNAGSTSTLDVRQPAVALNFVMSVLDDALDGPVGVVQLSARATHASNLEIADGTVSADVNVIAAVGTTYGTSGQLPDFRDVLPIGVGTSTPDITAVRGTYVGADSVTLTNTHVPEHEHQTRALAVLDSVYGASSPPDAFSVVQRSLPVYFIIAATGTVLASGDPKPENGPFVGEIRMWAGSAASVPAGWLLCDGALIADTTSDLANLIGMNGDGEYRTPDFAGRIPFGLPDAGVLAPAFSATAVLDVTNLAEHAHTGTNLVGPGYVDVTDIGSSTLGFSFTLDMPMTTSLYDTCEVRVARYPEIIYLPGDPGIGQFDIYGNPQLTPGYSVYITSATASPANSFPIGAPCVLGAPPTYSSPATAACNEGATLAVGASCDYSYTASYKILTGTSDGAGLAKITCPNTSPGVGVVYPTFTDATNCLLSEIVFGANTADPAVSGTCTASSYALGGSCTQECATGYSAFGSKTLTCGTGGAWSSSTIDCRQDCTIPTFTGSTTTCTAPFKQGSQCTWTAVSGSYRLSSAAGSDVVTCTAGPSTYSSTPTFAPARCATPVVPAAHTAIIPGGSNCFTDGSGNYPDGAICNVGCATGYTLTSGAASYTCSSSSLTVFSVTTGVAPVCKAECASAPSIPNSLPNPLCTYPVASGSQCTFQPAGGYYLVAVADGGATDSQTLTCNDGSFGTFPTYASVNCPPISLSQFAPSTVTNANTGTCLTSGLITPGSSDATCTLDCVTPYVRTAFGTVTCSNSKWTGTPPTCTAPCSPPASDPSYTVTYATPIKHGDYVTFSAAGGYFLKSGVEHAQCSFGVITVPTYASTTCKAYTPVGAGVVANSCTFTTGGSCTLDCDTGYTLVGSTGSITCTNGDWGSISEPVCKANCLKSDLPDITGATLSCDLGASASGNAGTCTYTALASQPSYRLTSGAGTNIITCTDGAFSSTRPTFALNDCGAFTIAAGHTSATLGTCTFPAKQYSGDTCTLGCTDGGSGPRTPAPGTGDFTCTQGVWTGTYPTCGASCTSFTASTPANGALVSGSCVAPIQDGEVCEYDPISVGFYLSSGSDTAFCSEGVFTQATAVFSDSHCDVASLTDAAPYNVAYYQPYAITAPVVAGACVGTGGPLENGLDCQLDCAVGYSRVGTGGLRRCTNSRFESSNGSPLLPTCKMNCPALDVPGSVYTCSAGTNHGSICSFNADVNQYKTSILPVSNTATCTDGTWSDLPTYASSKCPPAPLTAANAAYGTCPYAGRSTTTTQCQLECQQGYDRQSGGALTCTNSQWIGTQPTCVLSGNAFLVDSPRFITPGSVSKIVITAPAASPAPTALTIEVTCDKGYIQCGSASSCLASTCQYTFPANSRSATLLFTAPSTFSSTPARCTYNPTGVYLTLPTTVLYFGSPAGLSVANFPATATAGGAVNTAGTITPEWAPALEITVQATCRYGTVDPIYLDAGSVTPATIRYTPGATDNVQDVCKFRVTSTDENATASRFAVPADVNIKIGTPTNTFTFVGPTKAQLFAGGANGAEAGDAIALFVKPTTAATADVTLTLVCSGGHVGSATWPANTATLMNIPYVAAPQCGTESCQWFVTSPDAAVQASFEIPADAGWSSIAVGAQSQAYKQWRNQVRISTRKP